MTYPNANWTTPVPELPPAEDYAEFRTPELKTLPQGWQEITQADCDAFDDMFDEGPAYRPGDSWIAGDGFQITITSKPSVEISQFNEVAYEVLKLTPDQAKELIRRLTEAVGLIEG
jgi:hypothetical protein